MLRMVAGRRSRTADLHSTERAGAAAAGLNWTRSPRVPGPGDHCASPQLRWC